MFEDPEESLASIREDVERAGARAAALPLLQESIGRVRARAVSRGRDIAVEVDAGGVLTVLDITDAALSRGGRAVSREVMQLIAQATRDGRRQSLAVTTELLGDDDPIVQVAAAQLEDAEPRSWGSGVR